MYGSFSDQQEGIVHLLTRILRRVGPQMTAGIFFCGSETAGSFQQDFASLCCTTFTLAASEELSNSNHWRTLMVVIYTAFICIHGQIYDELKMPFLACSSMGHRLPLCKISEGPRVLVCATHDSRHDVAVAWQARKPP